MQILTSRLIFWPNFEKHNLTIHHIFKEELLRYKQKADADASFFNHLLVQKSLKSIYECFFEENWFNNIIFLKETLT